MLATIIDGAALWKIVVAVFVVGVGLTALFGEGIAGYGRLEVARREGRTGSIVANGALVAVTGIACVAAVVVGFIAMTHK